MLPILAVICLLVGLRFGASVRAAYGWAGTVVWSLVLGSLVPWFVHHGRVLDALRFGAVQSAWSDPGAFSRVHSVAYALIGAAALVSAGATVKVRWRFRSFRCSRSSSRIGSPFLGRHEPYPTATSFCPRRPPMSTGLRPWPRSGSCWGTLGVRVMTQNKVETGPPLGSDRPVRVEVNDLMQQGYVYVLSEEIGSGFHPEFQPDLTPPSSCG